ncbi:MAG TPA: DinB family protein [Burkholderiales bacterium]|nr:DinB family protein [Burkholderiales bacterium]
MIGWKQHFIYQVDYQHWANEQIFIMLDRFDDNVRKSQQGTLSESIHNSVDHMLVLTRVWFGRLKAQPNELPFNQLLHPDWRELKRAFRQELRDLQRWLETRPEDFFAQQVSYKTGEGRAASFWVRDLLTHLMLQLIHHRGQVTSVAGKLGAPAPELGYLFYRREMDKYLAQIRR